MGEGRAAVYLRKMAGMQDNASTNTAGTPSNSAPKATTEKVINSVQSSPASGASVEASKGQGAKQFVIRVEAQVKALLTFVVKAKTREDAEYEVDYEILHNYQPHLVLRYYCPHGHINDFEPDGYLPRGACLETLPEGEEIEGIGDPLEGTYLPACGD